MRPTNTTKQTMSHPELMMAEMMVCRTTSTIERQEAQGQQELAQSDVLPIDGIREVTAMIESNGGQIGERPTGDEIFINVKLPPGWKIQPTEHSMWSHLVDGKGRKRASIFYKAAFYDRSAHISADRRFTIDAYSHDVKGKAKASVKDACGEVKFETEFAELPDGKAQYAVRDALKEQVEDYLDKNFPDWRSPTAYWD